ncbi:MAG: hypothetical protein LBN23_06245 [Paludibacter sp.]|jgi:hypothetical protein|nr:hypothetical protein [Paludibacter sp.]
MKSLSIGISNPYAYRVITDLAAMNWITIENQKKIPHLTQMLLNGPVMSDTQFSEYQELKSNFSQWAEKKF